MDTQLSIQKYEEIRLVNNVSGYNAKVRKKIIEGGMISFLDFQEANPISTSGYCAKERTTLPLSFEPPALSIPSSALGKITELLTTVILNTLTNEVAL